MTTLAPWASVPAHSKGRLYEEQSKSGGQGERGPRDAYQRDRDRIIHSIAFRRLRHKTQVFLAPDGDHFRVRLTHSLEVAQIGRTIARTLGLNEDLTEALCLAHDIGHPPFGHAGEDALKAAMAGAGGFDHNGHTLRTLMRIERAYPRFDGLNLTWETLEGLAKHNGPARHPGWALAEADCEAELELGTYASLEAQVAALADDIAYDNHDIDDGLRAGLLCVDQLLTVPLVCEGWDRVRSLFPDVSERRQARELVRSQIGVMVNDLLEETRRRIALSKVRTVCDVRNAGQALVAFSDAMRIAERDLKRFMYANLYHHPKQLEAAAAAHQIVAGLFAAFHDDPETLPLEWRASLPNEEPAFSRHIADYIAGMTDRYAIREYVRVVGPVTMPDGF
ncbi:dGTPase [Sphingomonas sp. OV641]|uniref:deoxyguanosinetriphosphate triphosphohydrolase n=1 Tax=Sphingomonas sp. OV641 TaxID=1881068 RepID=UPI0008B6EA7B|nr:deoxyguanosinetriphosphate triphosphohydrolase [Sphingomonas sp. OV641]SEJ28468.1 dGTPase [Sphingomonas sp. OV641]